MDLSIAKRPCDSVTNKDWEMNAFLPENKRHFLPQDTLATKNHSSHFAPNLTLLSFQIRTCADVIQRCRLCLNNTVQKDSRGVLGTTFRFGRLSEILGKYPIWRTEHLKRPRNKVFTVHFTPFMYSACLNMKLASNCSMSWKKTSVSRR